MPDKMHQNTFGNRAPPRPDTLGGGTYELPRLPSHNGGLLPMGDGREGKGMRTKSRTV